MAAVVALTCAATLALPVNAQQLRGALPPAPAIIRDVEALPPLVRRMRGLIVEALRTGDAEGLRKPIETNEVPPTFTRERIATGRGPAMADALIALFRARSGDGQGRETMGQLLNILAVGAARVHAGQPQEMYVWPYFAALDPRLLTPAQEVDAYRVVSAHALAEWRQKRHYPGWRLGIGPDGTWHYLLGADAPRR